MTSSMPPSPDAVRQAIRENRSAPNGPLRNARGEELVVAAEQTGDRDLLRQALFGLITAYEFSTESGKMLVPFARLLQEWDRDPSDFDQGDAHNLHWYFKWASSGMLSRPEVPMASIEKWLGEMERRYRIAGYSEGPVRKVELHVAENRGDVERAARAFEAWTAAERNRMSDCHACELNDRGRYWAAQDEYEKALQAWEPVLAGRLSCAEEPHRVLAKSLLPLVALGRPDEARANHLRGYRMAKGNESLLSTIGLHIEFCALTGNEARGLELLAEHGAHLGSSEKLEGRLGFVTGVLVLLGRLITLGHGDRPTVAYEGEQRTVSELHSLLAPLGLARAKLFDERNGSTVVSDARAKRLERQPLLDALPLGVRSQALTGGAPGGVGAAPALVPVAAPAGAPVPAPAGAGDVQALVAEARRLRALGHPGRTAAWARVAEAVARAGADGGYEPDALLAADLLSYRAVLAGRQGEKPPRKLFADAAEAYRAAGEPAGAVLSETHLALAALQEGAEAQEVLRLLDVAAASAEALAPAETTRLRRMASVDLMRIKIGSFLAHQAHGHEHHGGGEEDGDPASAALSGFLERYAPHGGTGAVDGVDDMLADAEIMLAQDAWEEGDWIRVEALLSSAAARAVSTGRVWESAEPLSRLARLRMMHGRFVEAEESARAAVAHSAELTDPAEQGSVRLALAEALYRQDGKEEEAATYALEAAHWFDAAGDTAGAGAYARLVLAQAYGESGRPAEAAEVLESALPDLLEQGEDRAVRARETLAVNLRGLGDSRGAAEQYLRAAEVAKGWDDPVRHAGLASLAAECLASGGLTEEAKRAYARSLELWRPTGHTLPYVRALRSLAWLEVGGDRPDAEAVVRARALMDQALEALEGAPDDLLVERARTWAQLAELLEDELYKDDEEGEEDDEGEGDGGEGAAGDGVAVRRETAALWQKAVDAFAASGAQALPERVDCSLRLAWTEKFLGRKENALAGLRELAAGLSEEGTDEARRLLRAVERNLNNLT
ncbi:tetratricopeptide repeat protein [Streptomyces sp. ISL-99]|uniref:tetratricopeptide repeat protein n=1 Tax=Streptomyces sp. ISL-99 TaxID=2819193 RepID=UPI001BEC1EEF|nr:tetratricopeptide repeat protein [Streptomyces sp. ISL-99]MBT2526707.1 tetratricopeptide repeat protein [Streptomyces sp. ISL-99]